MELKLIFYCALLFCLNIVDSIPWNMENSLRYPEVYNNEATLQQFPPRQQYQDWNQQLNNNDRFYPNWQYPGPNSVTQNNGFAYNWPDYRYTPNAPAQAQGFNSVYPRVPENQYTITNTPSMQNEWQNVNQQPLQNQPIQNGFTAITDKQYFNQQDNQHHQRNQLASAENFNKRPQEIVEDNEKPNNVNYNQFYPPIPIVPNKPIDINPDAIIIDERSSLGAQPILNPKPELRAVPRTSVEGDDKYLASASDPVETISKPAEIPEEPIKNQIKKLISDPKIRGILSSGKRKRYMIIHPNGTIEHVNTLQSIAQEHPNYVLVHASNLVSKQKIGKQTIDEPNAQQTSSVDEALVQGATASSSTFDNIDPASVDNLLNAAENVESIPSKSPEELIPNISDTEIPVDEHRGDSEIKENLPVMSTYTDLPVNITLTPTNKDSSPIEIPPGGKVYVSVNSPLLTSPEIAPEMQVTPSEPIFNDTISDDNIILRNETGTESDLKNPSSGNVLSLVSDEAVSESTVPSDPNVNATASTKNLSKLILDGITNLGGLDISRVNTNKKPIVWFNSSEQDFWKKLSGSDNGFDVVYFFQIQSPPKVDNEKNRTVYPNGTIVEEITTTVWSPEQDKPTITTTTKIIQPEDKPVT